MNAKQEFIEHVGTKEVQAAILMYELSYSEPLKKFVLKERYNKDNYNEFLELLNFDYDDGFGGQELEGTIWYTDGTWSSRGEYDGSEWWEYHKRPKFIEEYRLMKTFR